MRAHHLAIIMFLALSGTASAQTNIGPAGSSSFGTMPNSGSLIGSSSSLSTGSNLSSSVGGVPNTSTPGIIGTNAAPSGLPGDDPQHPGFPAPLNIGH